MNVFRRVLATCCLSFFALLFLQTPSGAHTSFEFSEPADGSVIAGDVSEVVVHFSDAADPAGEGFVVMDSTGSVREPDVVTVNAAKSSWKLQFDPPLSNGIVGVRWTVQAPDAHPISGAFRFTIDASTAPGEPQGDTANPGRSGAAGNPSPPVHGADTSVTSQQPSEAATEATASIQSQDLDAFLNGTPATAALADEVGAFGRLLGLVGTMLAIGGLGFASFVIRDRRPDILSVLKAVGFAGLIVAVGSAIDVVAHLATANSGWTTFWAQSAIDSVAFSPFGIAVGMRTGAGLGIFAAARLMRRNLPLYVASAPNVELALAGARGSRPAGDGAPLPHTPVEIDERTDGARISPAMIVGILALLASFTFDGHTVTEGNRWITSAVDMVHVVAGSIWAGGVFAFAVVLWRRHRRAQRLNALELAVRFSVIAGGSLAAAGVAGSILAAIILDSVSDLWSTPWGLLLMAKFLAVAAAALLGGYNHFVVIPWLEARPADDARSVRLRSTVTAEALILAVVIFITALLVGAAS